jgi:hypothetical protein
LQISRERKREHAWNREHPQPPRRGPYVFHHRRTKNAAQAQSR